MIIDESACRIMHELWLDEEEVRLLRYCGLLPPHCTIPAQLWCSANDMVDTAVLLEAKLGDKGAQLAKHLNEAAILASTVYVALEAHRRALADIESAVEKAGQHELAHRLHATCIELRNINEGLVK